MVRAVVSRAAEGGRSTDAPSERPLLERDEDGLVRLHKLLARSGVASRRKCEELMLAGEVTVDGEVVTRLGTKIDPTTAVIRVSGQRLPPVSPNVYLVLNKPTGVVSTMSDPQGAAHCQRPGRRPARAAVPRRAARHRHRRAAAAHQRRRVRPADGPPVVRGRQDVRRRGRRARLTRAPSTRCSPGWSSTTARSPSRRRSWSARAPRDKSIVELVIHEGRNRIVRRLLDHVGHPVRKLTRTAIGPVQLGRLEERRAARADRRRAGSPARRRPAVSRRAPAYGGCRVRARCADSAGTVDRCTARCEIPRQGVLRDRVATAGPGAHRPPPLWHTLGGGA